MSSPTNIDGPEYQLTNCVVNVVSTWTEGPTIFKKDGQYYMTYCGNDVQQTHYQVHAAKGSSVATLSAQSGTNPILYHATPPYQGSGHNHVILGPDLHSLYTTYHLKKDGEWYRKLCVDKLYIESGTNNLLANGPNIWVQQSSPALCNWHDDFNRVDIGQEWTTVDVDAGSEWGLWGNKLMYGNSKGQGSPNWWSKAICTQTTSDDFVAEFNLKLMSAGPDSINSWPKFGIFVSQESQAADNNYNMLYIACNINNNSLKTYLSENGTGSWDGYAATLPTDNDFTDWHTIRVEKIGSTVKIFYDNMLKITRTDINLSGGNFGFITENSHADFGWVGFTNL